MHNIGTYTGEVTRKRHRPPNWTPRKSISTLLAEREEALRLASAEPSLEHHLEAEEACENLAAKRWAKAVEFGIPFNWRPTWECLEIASLWGRGRAPSWLPHEFFDHLMSFRPRQGRGPTSIVAQPYKPAFNLAEAEAFAQEHNLDVHIADRFESWYFPHRCTIVVWQRAGLGPAGRSPRPWSGRRSETTGTHL